MHKIGIHFFLFRNSSRQECLIATKCWINFTQLFRRCCKWVSNEPRVLENTNVENVAIQAADKHPKTLGLRWNKLGRINYFRKTSRKRQSIKAYYFIINPAILWCLRVSCTSHSKSKNYLTTSMAIAIKLGRIAPTRYTYYLVRVSPKINWFKQN